MNASRELLLVTVIGARRVNKKFFSTSTCFSPNVVTRLTQNVHKNMTLKHCGGVVPLLRTHATQEALSAKGDYAEYVPERKRPLTVILAWLAAKEKYLEKYRGIWLQRGFDVLTVKMTPYQFLAPTIGAKRLITDLLKFLNSSSTHYPDLILHCFSVGAYEFGEMLTQLKNEEYVRALKAGEENPRENIEKRIKGVILDSPVNIDGAAFGVARSISDNPVLYKTCEGLINAHFKLAYPFATKYYMEASDSAHNSHVLAPSLMLTSKGDPIGRPEMSLKLKNCWEQNGIHVDYKCFQKSGHVQHYALYPDEYTKQIDSFLGKVSFESPL